MQNQEMLLWHGQSRPFAKTISEAIQAIEPTFAGIRKQHGEEKLYAALIIELNGIIQFFNVGKSMSAKQLAETAKLFMREFFYLKPSDIHIFANQMKSGLYGQLYDRIDGSIILTNLRTYAEERSETAESLTIEKHKDVLAINQGQDYILKTESNYVRSAGQHFEETDKRELATTYTYAEAYSIKKWLSSEIETSIVRASAPEISLMDFIAKNKPELLPKGEAYRRATETYFRKKDEINASNLSDFEKNNEIRKLANIEPLTQEEYENTQKQAF